MTLKTPSIILNSDYGKSLNKPSFDITFSVTADINKKYNMFYLLHYFDLASLRADRKCYVKSLCENRCLIYNEANWEILLGGWEFKNNSITSKDTSEDNYLILKKELKDYIMEATITKIRGDFCYITIGIRQNIFEGGHEALFRNKTSSRQGYQFGIILDGRYNLFNGLNGLYYIIENVKGLFKKNWETSPLIDSIQNKVRIEAMGDIIKISLNGKDFGEFKNNSHLYGSPMFIVSKNTVIRFTDIKIIPR